MLFCRYARPQNAHIRYSMLRFFGLRKPKNSIALRIIRAAN